MLLKPLKGLGEVSAAGMYEEKGILVTKISGESIWKEWGFRKRDVILAVNGQKADSPEEAGKLLATETGEAQVWREQAARTLHWGKIGSRNLWRRNLASESHSTWNSGGIGSEELRKAA